MKHLKIRISHRAGQGSEVLADGVDIGSELRGLEIRSFAGEPATAVLHFIPEILECEIDELEVTSDDLTMEVERSAVDYEAEIERLKDDLGVLQDEYNAQCERYRMTLPGSDVDG